MKRIAAVIRRFPAVLSRRTLFVGISVLALLYQGNSTPVIAQVITEIFVPNSYTGSTKLLAPQAPDYSILNFVSDGNQMVTFSVPLEVVTFPGGIGWWGCQGNTEPWSASLPFKFVEFYSSQFCGDPWPTCSVELSLARPTTVFGFEAQTSFTGNDITVSFFNGPLLLGTISPPVASAPACWEDGSFVTTHGDGALLFAASVPSPQTINRVVVSSRDFVQIGRIRYGNACEFPTGETTASDGWVSTIPTVHRWKQTLQPSTVDFSGRTVRKTQGGVGADTCYFDGSLVPQGGNVSDEVWTVEAGNTWGDYLLGFSPPTVAYYRAAGRTPCAVGGKVQMTIQCGDKTVDGQSVPNFLPYGPVIDVQTVMTRTTVSSIHDGHRATRRWRSP
jgi:hypothetical protein